MRASEILREDSDDEEQIYPSVAKARAVLPQILARAQQDYDSWDESDQDTYAGGGICHIIADSICSVLYDAGINCTPVSCNFEQHVYVAAQFDEGVYTIDIPYHIYETGGGFTWKKLPDIKFEPGDVVFRRESSDPEEFDNYIDENFADGRNPGRKGLSRRVGIPKKATLSQLSKIAQSSSGERRRMAQWQLNMRRGRARKNK